MGPLIERFLRFLLPPQCHCCEKFLEEGQREICPQCLSQIRRIIPPFCTICGVPFVSREVENHPCGACITGKKYFTMSRAIGHYEGPLKEALHRWKYEEKLYLTSFFGKQLTEGLRSNWDPHSISLLLPVPLHPQRLRERGFNQALLLARELSQRTGIPFQKGLLQKKRPTAPQVSLGGAEREKGVRGSFSVRSRKEVAGKWILLIDDVFTTGATVNECSRVLLAAGAKRVDALTLARAVKIF